MTKTEEQLNASFPPEVIEELVQAVRQAYEANYGCYDPIIGHDLMTFGLMVYKSKVHFLSQLQNDSKNIKLIQKLPFFCMQCGEYKLSTYCAGHNGDADIAESFPLNKTRASVLAHRNQIQLRLPFPGFEDLADDSDCREVILADIGNPEEGALKIFIGIPIEKDKDGRVSKWGTTVPLWESDGTRMGVSIASAAASTVPPAVDVQPPTVTLKAVQKAKMA